MKSEKKNERNRKRREWLKEQGLCVRCGKSRAREGRTLCEKCAADQSKKETKRYWDKTPEEREAICKNAYAHQKEKRAQRKEQGLCWLCGGERQNKEYKLCDECRKKRAKWQAEYYTKRRMSSHESTAEKKS